MALVIQINVNHARQAQDLLLHNMAEWGAELAFIAEPHNVPTNSTWAVDLTGKAAIHVTGAGAVAGLYRIESGHGFVVARWRDMDLVSCYISPNVAIADLEKILRGMHDAVKRNRGGKILVRGGISTPGPSSGDLLSQTQGGTLS